MNNLMCKQVADNIITVTEIGLKKSLQCIQYSTYNQYSWTAESSYNCKINIIFVIGSDMYYKVSTIPVISKAVTYSVFIHKYLN